MRQTLRTLYLPFFIVVALMTIFGPAQPLWRLWEINADPASAKGRVVRLNCHDHGHVEYSFEAEGVSGRLRRGLARQATLRVFSITERWSRVAAFTACFAAT